MADWLALVRLAKLEDAKSVVISSWGKSVTCYYAPLKQPVKIGGLFFGKEVNATFCGSDRGGVAHSLSSCCLA